jgi:kinetochore protein NDC80
MFARYEQLTLRANALREELHTEIEKMLNDIIKFKVHIQKNLEEYEGFVVDEVEHELGGDEDGREDTQDIEMRKSGWLDWSLFQF